MYSEIAHLHLHLDTSETFIILFKCISDVAHLHLHLNTLQTFAFAFKCIQWHLNPTLVNGNFYPEMPPALFTQGSFPNLPLTIKQTHDSTAISVSNESFNYN